MPERRVAQRHDGPGVERKKPIPFASVCLNIPRMADEILGKVLEAMRAKPRKGRGAVYRWLWLYYDELMKAFAETDAGWNAVSAAMRDAGVVGARGNPPTRKSLPRVWARVVRDKTAVPGEPAQDRGRLMPSRLPPTSRPLLQPALSGDRGTADSAEQSHEPVRRKMKVLRSLDEARAAIEAAPAEEAGPAPAAGAGVLPRAQWPKPFN